ncbi:hypothetical protein JCM5353_000377 [Sporobolomyces roseus]
MVDFPSIPGPKEEFRTIGKLYDRLLLAVFPLSGYNLDRSSDPVLTCNFRCVRGRWKHEREPACTFVIQAKRLSPNSRWTIPHPPTEHDHESIPLLKPRRGTELARVLEKFGVEDDFWVDGSDEDEEEENADEDGVPIKADQDEDQLEQDDSGDTPPVQKQLALDGLRYQKRQRRHSSAQPGSKAGNQRGRASNSGQEVIDLTGEDSDEDEAEDEEFEAGQEAEEGSGKVAESENESGNEQEDGGEDDSGVFVGSDIGEIDESANGAAEEEEGEEEGHPEAVRDESQEPVASPYYRFQQFLDSLDEHFDLRDFIDVLWYEPFLIRSREQMLKSAELDLKGLVDLFKARTGFGPACGLRRGLEDLLAREQEGEGR